MIVWAPKISIVGDLTKNSLIKTIKFFNFSWFLLFFKRMTFMNRYSFLVVSLRNYLQDYNLIIENVQLTALLLPVTLINDSPTGFYEHLFFSFFFFFPPLWIVLFENECNLFVSMNDNQPFNSWKKDDICKNHYNKSKSWGNHIWKGIQYSFINEEKDYIQRVN